MSKLTPLDISTISNPNSLYHPKLHAMFTRWGLYDPVTDWNQQNGDLRAWFGALIYLGACVDLYCPACGEISVFSKPDVAGNANQFRAGQGNYPVGRDGHQFVDVAFYCARDNDHVAKLDLLVINGRSVQKVGQFPSLADLAEIDLDQYRKVLGPERLRELKTGVGLFAHGVGIGSLIYLRRTLELIVSKAESAMISEKGKLPYAPHTRMVERIGGVSEYLPEFIAGNKTLYGHISDGLHNRTDEDCKALFAPCLDGIKLALDDMESARAKSEKMKKAQQYLEKVTGQLNAIKDDPNTDEAAS